MELQNSEDSALISFPEKYILKKLKTQNQTLSQNLPIFMFKNLVTNAREYI